MVNRIHKKTFQPSFPLAEERVVQHSADRVSNYTSGISANALTLMHWRVFTHPDIATLVDPLFRKRERG
jgi:hypothetical protein